MRRTRDRGPDGGQVPGGERDAQNAAPNTTGAGCAGKTADMSGPTGEPDFLLATLEAEVGLTTGPWETGMSTHDRQSLPTLSSRAAPGAWGALPTGSQGPS